MSDIDGTLYWRRLRDFDTDDVNGTLISQGRVKWEKAVVKWDKTGEIE